MQAYNVKVYVQPEIRQLNS